MKIDYASDLHFNHWMLWTQNQNKWERNTRALTNRLIENGSEEVLILAGDFSEWNCQALWILEEVAKKYERVYFTYGNHDLYLLSRTQKKKYEDSLGRIKELAREASKINNVVPLIKSVDEYKGKIFAGDMMFYLPQNEGWDFFRYQSNDSNYISLKGFSKKGMVRKMWQDSMDWYATLEETDIDVFVSHVPPVHSPFSQNDPNTCYMTKVPFINAKHWICGHDHLQCEFTKAGVHFHMNAIGYPVQYSWNSRVNYIPPYDIDPQKIFDVKTFEI